MIPIYRPHFAYSTPEGCRDEPYEYYYDPSNVAASVLPAGQLLPSMVFGPFDKDAPFHWRALRVRRPAVLSTAADLAFAIQFRANGELLSDAPINIVLYAIGAGFPGGQFRGGMAVPLDEEIVCPPGAVIEATWLNDSATSITVPPIPGITLLGVKRYWEGREVA